MFNIESMSLNERAMAVASAPLKGYSGDSSLRSRSQLCRDYHISLTSAQAAAAVLRYGTTGLQKAVREGLLPVSTAKRVAALPAEEQDVLVERLLKGARWENVVSYTRRHQRRVRKATPFASNVRREALAGIRDSLAGLQYVLDRSDGLDPEITPTEAAVWLRDLGHGRKYLIRLTEMLKERSS